MNHQLYIDRCFQIAKIAYGSVSPNPAVGACIVHKDTIIGEGWHREFGGPHAEINAFSSVSLAQNHLIEDSTLFISLEPCFHVGKTPPCVDKILESGIRKVVIGMIDPNPKVKGKSVNKMREAGITVEIVPPTQESWNFYNGFLTTHLKKRPFIALKYAETADGYLGLPDRQVWLSNIYLKRLTHKWRSEYDAIMVGTNTAALDNPDLTNRHYFGNSPLRVILDRTLRIPKSHNIYNGQVPTLIFTEVDPPPFGKNNLEYLTISFDDNFEMNVLECLLNKGVQTLMIEGGGTLLKNFIEKNLWDEISVFKTDKSLTNGIPSPKLNRLPDETCWIANDQILSYSNRN